MRIIMIPFLLACVRAEEDLDFPDWIPQNRVERGSDYGGNVGGPVAAGPTIPPDYPTDITVTDSCPASDCKYDMRPHQRLAKTSNHKSLGYGICNSTQECLKECEKRRCNHMAIGGLSPPYSAHFYAIQGQNIGTFVQADMFDSFTKVCSSPNHKQKRQAPGGSSNASPSGNGTDPNQDNRNWIDQANKARKAPDDAKFDAKHFMDEDRKTFAGRFGGAKVDAKEDISEIVQSIDLKGVKNRPKLDWRQYNVIPPIRHQGSCGSSYAFASADLIAAQNGIERRKSRNVTTGETVQPLSPQYLMDCSPRGVSQGCNGGRPIRILQSMATDQSMEGVPLEYCQPYQDQSATCLNNDLPCCHRRKIQKVKMFDISSNEKQLMASLLNSGPVLALVNVNEAWQFYNGTGIIKSYQCNSKGQNHAITIIGYDFTASTPYYIVKNSWSTKWGIDGYAKLEAGTNACGVAKYVLTTCVRNCQSTMKDTAAIFRRNNVPQ